MEEKKRGMAVITSMTTATTITMDTTTTAYISEFDIILVRLEKLCISTTSTTADITH